MKSLNRVLIIFIALFVFFTINNPLLFSQNLITNGDFESGYANGWNHLAGDGGVATYSDETSSPYQGSHSLKVIIDTLGANAWSIQSMGPTVALTIGEDYTLTFWGKAAAAGTDVKMVIQNTIYTGNTKSLGTDWAQYTWSFTAQEIDPSIRIQFPQTGTVWLDDIQLTADTAPPPGAIEITVSPGTKHQTMDGFGAAISWYATWIYGGNNGNDDELNQLMFNDSGLDILRIKNWYYPGEGTDNDAAAVAKAVSDARAINPNIQVLMSSWSPPASLKSNDERANGGTLKSDGGGFMYDELATYWVDLLTNMGWSPDYLSFQNEPGWTATWDSCIFSPTEGTNASYGTALDTIWTAIKDMPNCPKIVSSDTENMPNFMSQNSQLQDRTFIDVNAYHTYDIGSTASNIDSANTLTKYHQIRDDYASRPNWVTEFSSSSFNWITQAWAIHAAVTEADASGYIFWKLAWGSSDQDTMIEMTATNGSYTVNDYFYTIKHFAKCVDKGYKRIEVSGSTSDIKVSGYLAPDLMSITMVAINKSASAEQISLDHLLTVSSIEGYQSVTDSYWQTMSGLNVDNPIDLPANSLTTLVITLTEEYNTAPVASDSSLETFVNQDLLLTLQAVDDDGDDLTYTVLSGPDHGQLTGTGANRTYSPTTDYTGSDTITFKVNDTKVDSNTATVSITVRPPNTPPSVEAGDPQTVTLPESGGSGSPVSGAYYEWDAANDTAGDSTWNSTTANTDRNWTFASAQTGTSITDPRFTGLTKAYEFPTAIASATSLDTVGSQEDATFEFVLDTDTDNGVIFETGGSGSGMQVDMHGGDLRFHVQSGFTLSTTLSGTDKGRFIHVVGVIDITNGKMYLYLDGNLVDSELSFTATDWAGGNGSGLGKMESSTASEGAVGGTEAGDFTGKIALLRYYRNKAFNATEVTQNFNAINAGQEITATLAATVSDVDGDEFTTTWTLESGPVGETVTFNDPSLEDASATFYAPGTYVLRLTADDSFDTNYDEVTITVNDSGTTTYTVTYDGNGSDGGSVPLDETAYSADDTVTVLGTGTITRDGYTFSHWDTILDGSGTDYNENDTFTITTNITLYAQWTINQYTVTFDLDGKGTRTGGGALVQTINHGGNAVAPTVDPDPGYSFDSWDVAFTNVTGTLTVTAQYSLLPSAVSASNVSVPEGGSNTVSVVLTSQPTGNVIVTASVASGDSDLTITGGSSLTFTTADWDQAQTVTISAAEDNDDNTNGTASISLDADDASVTDASITATEIDDDYTLAVSASNGSVAKNPETTYYDSGSTVELTPTADTGYQFVNWSGDASGSANPLTVTMDADKSITANFALTQYTITFDSAGGTAVTAITQGYGTSVTAPADPTKVGYSFTGWIPSVPATMPASDTTCVAQWTALTTYTVTYNGNGNDGGTVPSNQTKYEGIDLTLDANSGNLSKTDFIFAGWNTQANGLGTDYAAGATYNTDADLDLYAKWEDSSLLVYEGFQYGTAGVDRASSDLLDNQPNGVGGDVAPTGLGGAWTEQDAVSATTDFFVQSGSLVFGDLPTSGNSVRTDTNSNDDRFSISVTADLDASSELWFSIIAEKLQNNNSAAEGGFVIGNQTVSSPRVLLDTGSTGLQGFAVAPTTSGSDWTAYAWNGTTQTVGDASLTVGVGNGDTRLLVGKIVFDAGTGGTDQFTLYEYQLNGGSVVGGTLNPICSTIEVDVDQSLLDTLSLTRQVNTAYDEIRIGASLAAVVPVPSATTYTVTYDGNNSDGGTVPVDTSTPYDSDATVTVIGTGTMTRTGYTFSHWDLAQDGNGTDYNENDTFTITENVTLYAQWTVNQYTITFDSDGGTAVVDITLDYEATVTPPADPTKTGYTFAGWSPTIPATMPVDGLAVTAQWTVNQYTITFDSDGGTAVADITLDYGATVTPPADPTKTGYTFAGWSPALPANMPVDGLAVTAQWTVNQYTITFDSDGGTAVTAITQDYGSAVTAPTAPTKTGYTFTAWSPSVPATMPASDTTCVAQWTHDGTPHSADGNSDWSISQTEVESFITAYAGNNNTVTTTNGNIDSGRITIREVMRVIYLYNDGGAYIGGQSTVDTYDIAAAADPAETLPSVVAKPETEGDGSLVVSSTADSGVGSLRDAIAIAADGETITIDDSLGTITVLSEIVIDKSITIDGQGAAIVSGENQTRIFRIQNDERDIYVTLKNMGITDAENSADEFGGAIYNNGQTLTLDTVLLDGNENTFENGKGGAVYTSGTLNTDNCVFRNNKASEENDVYQE